MKDFERRKVFWLLKKYSSYTAWKALGDAFCAFVDEWALAMRKANANDVNAFNRNATNFFWMVELLLKRGCCASGVAIEVYGETTRKGC